MADEQHSVKIAMAQISPATLWDFFSAIKFGNGKKLNNRLIVIKGVVLFPYIYFSKLYL